MTKMEANAYRLGCFNEGDDGTTEGSAFKPWYVEMHGRVVVQFATDEERRAYIQGHLLPALMGKR